MQTSYASQIVSKFLNREAPVIEVNMEPCVKVGHTYHVVGKSEEVLPQIFDTFYGKQSAQGITSSKKPVLYPIEEEKVEHEANKPQVRK